MEILKNSLTLRSALTALSCCTVHVCVCVVCLMCSNIALQPVKGMDWIEDLIFQEEDMLVVGFHTVSE